MLNMDRAWCEKATSVGNSSSWLPRVWTVWTYFMLMPPHHYLTHTLHTLKKHILSSGWFSYFYALISPFCSKYPKKAFWIPYLVLTISAPLRTLNSKPCWWSMLEVATGKSDGDKKSDQIYLIHLKKKWCWLWSWWRWRQWYECYDMTRLIYSLPTPNGLLWLFLGQIVKLCSILFTLPNRSKVLFYAFSKGSQLNWPKLVTVAYHSNYKSPKH